MMELKSDLLIKCNKCGKIHLFYKDDLEESSYSYERNMGPEIEYDFDGEIQCDCCQNYIKFTISGWEYPIGAFNYENFEIDGGTFEVNPTVDVIYFEEFYFDSEELEKLYDPIEQLKQEILGMEPREFELFIGDFFKKQGYETEVTRRTRDGGFDVICKKNKPYRFVLLVECKHYTGKNTVGVEIVRELFGVQNSEKANKSLVITTSHFTKDAKEFADKQETLMDLVDIEKLLSWIMDTK